jgi:hypothetical protein
MAAKIIEFMDHCAGGDFEMLARIEFFKRLWPEIERLATQQQGQAAAAAAAPLPHGFLASLARRRLAQPRVDWIGALSSSDGSRPDDRRPRARQ